MWKWYLKKTPSICLVYLYFTKQRLLLTNSVKCRYISPSASLPSTSLPVRLSMNISPAPSLTHLARSLPLVRCTALSSGGNSTPVPLAEQLSKSPRLSTGLLYYGFSSSFYSQGFVLVLFCFPFFRDEFFTAFTKKT